MKPPPHAFASAATAEMVVVSPCKGIPEECEFCGVGLDVRPPLPASSVAGIYLSVLGEFRFGLPKPGVSPPGFKLFVAWRLYSSVDKHRSKSEPHATAARRWREVRRVSGEMAGLICAAGARPASRQAALRLDAHGIHGTPRRQDYGCPRYPIVGTKPAPWQKQSRHGRLLNLRASDRSACHSVRNRMSTHAGNVPHRRGSCRSRLGLSLSCRKRRTENLAALKARRRRSTRYSGARVVQHTSGSGDQLWPSRSLCGKS